ncbi:proteasome-associated protein ECM29 homolog isoform X1 [Eutrema salsugineum]|uniref:proteasome-associated protein ECM29 homolog isoform X1 n=1 Tax=Eutrema salsugineum TaxID=72664 RepID=UPI000CECF0F7|nr:proteasome-associated protein ECM29 homolog isoform X1 [Eutrema salsugineum]
MLDRIDSKLEAPVSKLPPLTISSLSSQSPAVRNKVLEILSHVNKRVKHQHEIGLPLLDLWKLYTDPAASPMVRNFVSCMLRWLLNELLLRGLVLVHCYRKERILHLRHWRMFRSFLSSTRRLF